MSQQDKPRPDDRQSLGSVFRSVSASMFGVQSSKKHKEDFARGNARAYAIVGLAATLLFILVVWGVVQLVVHVATPA